MANGKKSFVLYADLLKSVDHLTDEELGKLFKHILEYVNDLSPELTDRLLVTAWKPIERSLKEDLMKWEKQLEQRRQAGKKSAEVRKRNATSVNDRSSSSTDSVTVTVSDSVINKKDIYRKFAHLSITKKDFEKLKEHWSESQVTNTLDDIENFAGNKKYKSLYLTARKWLNKNHPIKQQSEATELTDLQKFEQAKARQAELKKHF